ncbi:hypothetical protein [Microbacterium phyllosphaerae]|uniref:hypothetical protein n=1 Tax=Microbacterium phyllosphaerae TaxID=124798 RepID=UPI00216A16A9|nr:hypothetical protein [Microbacterium phyllosphaerae]MCS3443804.1 hypothetical protein [Microbacterium phyllosphaerae]
MTDTAAHASEPDAVAVKRCGACGEVKPHTEYNRKSSRADGRQELCRECNRESSRRYYRRNREHHISVIRARTDAARAASTAVVAAHLLDHPCVDCGVRDLRVLDFDHRPGVEKRDAVMQLVRNGFSLAVVAVEIAKCDVRCRNCHAIITYQRMDGDWRSRAMREQSALG